MRIFKENEIPQLIRDKKVNRLAIRESGKVEHLPSPIDWNKRQVEATESLAKEQLGQSQRSISLMEQLIKGMELNSLNLQKLLQKLIDKFKTQDKIPVGRPTKWKFNIYRDQEGKIDSIEAAAEPENKENIRIM